MTFPGLFLIFLPPKTSTLSTGFFFNIGLFSGQFMTFPKPLIFDTLKNPTQTNLTQPTPWGGLGQIFFSWEWVPYILSTRICVPNLVAVRRSCQKKGGVQTDRETDRRKLQLYIVDGCILWTENKMFYLFFMLHNWFIDILSALKSFENTVKA